MSDLRIRKGKTFSHVLRYGAKPFVYKEITAITKTAPARVTATAHGLVDGWPAAVVSAGGMKEINAESAPPKNKDYRQAAFIDANTVEFNDINAAEFRAYTSGGYLQYFTPVDLAGSTSRMVVRTKVGGEIIASSDTAHVTAGAAQITVNTDNTAKTITFLFTDEVTTAIVQKTAVFECEFHDALGAVHYLDSGEIEFTQEIAT